MPTEIDLFEAIYSQRQITRYKPDPVPQAAIQQMIDAAVRAPNGGNTQPWEFVVVNDSGHGKGARGVVQEHVVGRHGLGAIAHRVARLPARPLPGAPHARGSGDDCGVRGSLTGRWVPTGPAHRTREARRIDLAGDPKPFPGRPGAWPGNSHNHRPEPQGRRSPRDSGTSRVRGDDLPDPGRVSAWEFWPDQPAPAI